MIRRPPRSTRTDTLCPYRTLFRYLLGKIERGGLDDDHPLSSAIMRKVVSRRALYVSVLLHDIAQGRGGDPSVLGADVSRHPCPRLGLHQAATETGAWLVEYPLLMSSHAFRRVPAGFKPLLPLFLIVPRTERTRPPTASTIVGQT